MEPTTIKIIYGMLGVLKLCKWILLFHRLYGLNKYFIIIPTSCMFHAVSRKGGFLQLGIGSPRAPSQPYFYLFSIFLVNMGFWFAFVAIP